MKQWIEIYINKKKNRKDNYIKDLDDKKIIVTLFQIKS